MTIVTVEDILAAVLERKIARVKADFAKEKDHMADVVRAVMIVLTPVWDKPANETNLREAEILTFELKAQSLPFGQRLGSRVLKDFVGSVYRRGTEVVAEARTSAMSREEIIKEFKLSPKAVVAFDKGATIGELFVIQPDLYV